MLCQFQISNVKKFTAEGKVFEALETFTPKPLTKRGGTLPDLFRNIKKQQQQQPDKNSPDKKRPLPGGFVTAAAQLEECKRTKLETSGRMTVNASVESEVITNDGKQDSAVDRTNKMDDTNRSKGDKLKMLFGDAVSDGEEAATAENGDGKPRKHEEGDRKRDHKHARRKCDKRKCDSNNKTEDDVSDSKKQKCTNETKASENGASGSVVAAMRKKQEDGGKKRPKLKKTEIGTLVVKLLTPAYAEKRFDSRDTFKTMARSISHALLDKDESEIKKYVEDFLKNHLEITSRTTI